MLGKMDSKEREQLFNLMDLLGVRATQRTRRVLDLATLADRNSRIVETKLDELAELWGIKPSGVKVFLDRMSQISVDGIPLLYYSIVPKSGKKPLYRIYFASWFPLFLAD